MVVGDAKEKFSSWSVEGLLSALGALEACSRHADSDLAGGGEGSRRGILTTSLYVHFETWCWGCAVGSTVMLGESRRVCRGLELRLCSEEAAERAACNRTKCLQGEEARQTDPKDSGSFHEING